MNKRRIVVTVIIVFILLGAGMIFKLAAGPKDIVAQGDVLTPVENSYESLEQVYSREYQDNIFDTLALLREEEHTLENPLIVANPYSTNTTGIYLYFTTEKQAKVKYTVHTEGYEDFSETLYNGEKDNLATVHEYMVIGCVPQEKNEITIAAEDQKGKSLGSYTFEYQAPALLNPQNKPVATITKGESTQPLSHGFYTVLGNDTTEDEDEEEYVAIYDNNGINRCEIPIVSFRSHGFIFDQQGMYYSISSRAMACMDRTGYVRRIYPMGDFTLHHDYVFGGREDILILASEANTATKDDRIVSLDIETGEVTEVVNLMELYPNYMDMTTLAQGATVLDWMHLNSMDYLEENDSIIISARDTSAIIRLDNIYEQPETNYLISSPNFWSGTGYEEYLLEQAGDFSLQGGQHCVTCIEDDSLEDGQYYLALYNNNNVYSFSRKDYDWDADDSYFDTGVANDSRGNPSYYYKYLVDENARTFTLVDSIPVDYSGFVSSVQNIDGNVVIDSGACFTTYEYDGEGKLIQKLTYGGNKWIYRTMKYDYTNYWFAE